MNIRIATTTEEMEEVGRLRYRCSVEEMGWDYDPVQAGTKELRDDLDAHGTIYYAEVGGRMVGTYCIHFGGGFAFPEKWQSHYALERFADFPESTFSFSSRLAVLEEFRGSTVAPRMLMEAYRECWRRGTKFSFCHCRPRLVELYERLGFIRYKENIVENVAGYMVPMVLLNEDAEHLRLVRSPFQKICESNRHSGETARWFDGRFPDVRSGAIRQKLAPEDFWNDWSEAMNSGRATLLRGLRTEQLKELLKAGTVLRCRAGDVLLREGEAGHEMFLILGGTARFSRRRDDGSESEVGFAGQGEIFGEIAFMSKCKRNASVYAMTDLQVLVISQEFLNRAMKSLPETAMPLLYNLSLVFAEKLRSATDSLQDAVPRPDCATPLA